MQTSAFSLTVLSFLLAPVWVQASPYASAVTESGNIVGFILNEPADSVKVAFDGGPASLVIGTTGQPVTAGSHTFSKAGHTTYAIEVVRNAGAGWQSGVLQQISDDSNTEVKFGNGRGVAVNCKPDSGKYFGRIYVSVGANGTSGGRTTNEGIYVLNADMEGTALGTGPLNGLPARAATPVPSIVTSGTNSPYRLTVGDKGDLFITDWSDANGSVYKTNGDVTGLINLLPGPVGSGFPVGNTKFHGSIAGVAVSGSEDTGDLKLWTVDEDLQSDQTSTSMTELNSVWAWDSNGDPLPFVNAPVKLNNSGVGIAANPADLARGEDGILYKMIQRSGGDTRNIFAIGLDGALISDSRAAWRAQTGQADALDPFLESVACDISRDGWLVVLRNRDNALHLVKVANGLFDFSTYILLYTTPTLLQARDVSFDIAGNIYSLSSGQALLRVYSRGGHTKAVTTSAGGFTLTEVTPTPAAPPLNFYPEITSVSQTGSDLMMTMVSRVGFADTHIIQRSQDLGESGFFPWETLVNANNPYTITGTIPNYNVKITGVLANPEARYFYRIRRN